MKSTVVIDTNLLLLFIVGTTDKAYIGMHKRLKSDYTEHDFLLLVVLISQFSDIVLLPHIVTETSNLISHIDDPARSKILKVFKNLINTVTELPIASAAGVARDEFYQLGITDAVILHLCTMEIYGIKPTLITTDGELANRANSLGYSVIDYRSDFMA